MIDGQVSGDSILGQLNGGSLVGNIIERGPKGDTGPANTLSIGTVTSGSTASATITGTAPNQTLSLVLPKGDKGDTGEKGDTGNTGATGPQGLPGVGVPSGGQANQVLAKNSDADYDTKWISGGGGGGVSDYDNLTNRPQINGVTLTGNKSTSDLGLATKTSDLTNDSGYITKNVNDLTNYTLTSSLGDLALKDTVNYETEITNKPTIPTNYDFTLNGLRERSYNSLTDTPNLSEKQNKFDSDLTTTVKNVVPAINEVNSIAKGSNQALGFTNYSTLISSFNNETSTKYRVGQNIYVITTEVPDLWVSSVEESSSTYTYTTDAQVINDLETNGYIQCGYYKLSMLETQKVDLTNYYTKSETTSQISSALTGYATETYVQQYFDSRNGNNISY